MREAAALIDGDNLEFEGDYDDWDADMIHGCVCDEGWEGYDCSLRSAQKWRVVLDQYHTIEPLGPSSSVRDVSGFCRLGKPCKKREAQCCSAKLMKVNRIPGRERVKR